MSDYLKAYQQSLGLVPDGVIGKKTAAAMMQALGIDSPVHFAHFIAQAEHESEHFTAGRENMNYSAQRMADVWPGRFAKQGKNGLPIKPYRPNANALALDHQPVKLANWIYGSRDDLGNRGRDTNDGWDFRGGGAGQLTGRNNYLSYFKHCGLPETTDTDIILLEEHYFASFKFWFDDNHVWRYADKPTETCVNQCGGFINRGNATRIPLDPEKRLALAQKAFKIMGLA